MYDIHDKLILRTPRLSIDQFISCTEKDDPAKDPSFLEALYLASPDLVHFLETHENGMESSASNTIMKYFIRSCFRPTPFGLFAGVSVIEWGNNSSVQFDQEVRHTHLDLQWIENLAKHLLTNPQIKQVINFTANNTIYTFGQRLRYIEYNLSGNRRNYKLSEIDLTQELQTILSVCEQPASYRALVDIVTSTRCRKADARLFIDALIDNQILISELEPQITGDDNLVSLVRKLKSKKFSGLEEIISRLEKARSLMKSVDSLPNGIKAYEPIKTELRKFKLEDQENNLIKVDLFNTTSNRSLSLTIKKNLKTGLEGLVRLATQPKNEKLESFKARFLDRYGEREMPLLEVLDGDGGIGYPESMEGDVTPLTRGIVVSPETEVREIQITRRDRWLQQKLHHALFQGDYGITIEPKEISVFETNWRILPASFSAIFRVVNFSASEIYIEGAGGSSAIQTLGRFAYADKEIANLISDIVEAEEKAERSSIVAEIVHMPEARIGNVLWHPTFFKYEIPYLTAPCPEAKVIPVPDLYLRIDSGEIKLMSKRLNKEIVPRLSNANNFELSPLPVYRFLCDLQTQNCSSNISFNWGPISEDAVFLPRVIYCNVLLHLATWRLQRSEWEHLLAMTPENLKEVLIAFRTKWRLPRFISLVDFDEELFIDLDSSKCVQAWLSTIRQKHQVVLKEYLFDHESPIRDKQGGRYFNQFIATVTKQTPITPTEAELKLRNNIPLLNRSFYPGSEWMYFKIYCSIKSADEIIVRYINPGATKLLKDRLVRAWFFVRFKDPYPHLRVRLQLKDISNSNMVMQSMNGFLKEASENKTVWRIQLDTYERELERYGPFLELAEEIFFHDSTAIALMLKKLSKIEEKEEFRWLLSIRVIDSMLSDFGLTPDAKIALMERLKSAFSRELKVEKKSQLEIDKKYRGFKPRIEAVMKDRDRYLAYSRIIERRSKKMRTTIKSIQKVEIDHQGVIQTVEALVESFIHLSINRLLSHTHRLQERIIYDFMWRFYRSEKARFMNKE